MALSHVGTGPLALAPLVVKEEGGDEGEGWHPDLASTGLTSWHSAASGAPSRARRAGRSLQLLVIRLRLAFRDLRPRLGQRVPNSGCSPGTRAPLVIHGPLRRGRKHAKAKNCAVPRNPGHSKPFAVVRVERCHRRHRSPGANRELDRRPPVDIRAPRPFERLHVSRVLHRVARSVGLEVMTGLAPASRVG